MVFSERGLYVEVLAANARWHKLCRVRDVVRLKLVTGLILFVLCSLDSTVFTGQTQDIGWEVRPKVVSIVELLPRTRIETWGELQHGTNFSFQRWRGGALLDRRL